MTGETRKRKWDICFDPRTKVLLLIISMIIATTAPSLSYECALILLIAFMGILCGKVRYSIIGTIVFLALYINGMKLIKAYNMTCLSLTIWV